MLNEDVKKHVDETWKQQAEAEKRQDKENKEDFNLPEKPDIKMFLAGLNMQAFIALGKIANPVTGKKEKKDLKQAKYIIDTIEMIKEKTKGNLTGEEANFIDSILYQLQMLYVEESK